MRELPVAPVLSKASGEVTKTSKTERREVAAAAARAKRAALTGAVLEGLLRQAQLPFTYQE